MAAPLDAINNIFQSFYKNNGKRLRRPLFFLCIIFLSTYLPSCHVLLKGILYSLILAILSSEFINTKKRQKQLASIFLMLVAYFSLENPIFLTFLSITYHSQFNNKDYRSGYFLSTISSSLPILIVLFETLQQFGLPYGVFLIWWWGLGYLALIILLFLALRKYTFIVIALGCVVSLCFCENLLFQKNPPIYILSNNYSNIGFTNKNVKAISDNIEIISEIDVNKINKNGSYIIPIFDHPLINESFLNKISKPARFLLFAEHDNLGNFIDKHSNFNFDSYHRKGPWIVYKPIFRTDLKLASNKDPLYCSNIGCTISWNIWTAPILWDYGSNGTPILLATTYKTQNKYFILIGDSDVIVPFLSPYNSEFLRRLLGQTDHMLLLQMVSIIIASIIALYFRNPLGLSLQVGLIVLSIAAGYHPDCISGVSDFNVITDLKIRNPHYDFNYSSIPLKLAKKGYHVALNQKNKSKIEIYVVDGNKRIENQNQTTIVFLYPEATVYSNATKIEADCLPLGRFKDSFIGIESIIIDARSLVINGEKTNHSILQQNNVTYIATGSPQKNIPLITTIYQKYNVE